MNYHELPHKEARARALQTLALAKWVTKTAAALASPLEKEAKEWLRVNDLDPGSRVPAMIDDANVATISRSVVKERRTISVDDEQAYGDWLVENDHDNPFEVRLVPWATSAPFLETLIDSLNGELPDGVSVHTSTTGGTVTVGQTDAQREALEQKISHLRSLLETFDALTEIEAGEQS